MTEGQIEIPYDSESGRTLRLIDTIALPLERGEFIHIETSKVQLVSAFSEYARKLGHDPDEARAFFDEKVDFTFGKLKNNIYPPQYTKFDEVINKAIVFLQGGGYLGSVAHSRRGGYELALNTRQIQKYMPKLKHKNAWRVENYPEQIKEEKIASVQQTIDSIIYHEFYHILQFMKQPGFMDKAVRKGVLAQRIFCAWTAATLTTSQIAPNFMIPVAGLGMLAAVGGILYVQKDGVVKVEEDAYEMQKKSREINLTSKPFTYIHESDSQPL